MENAQCNGNCPPTPECKLFLCFTTVVIKPSFNFLGQKVTTPILSKANLEKKLSFDISFKLLAEPKWHCDTQSLNQIINVSLTTFLRCIGSALAKSINSSTSGYLYCMLFSSCDMLVKTSPCTVPGKHFCFKFPYFRLNFNGILDSLFICEKLPIVSNCFTKCFLAVIRFIALYICKSAAICSSIGEFTRQKC